jgi:hypothetical protein
LEPAIRTARENGYTWDQIVQHLNEKHGLDTTVAAVRNYLGPRYEARKGKAQDKTTPALPVSSTSNHSRLSASQTAPGGFRIRPDSDKI